MDEDQMADIERHERTPEYRYHLKTAMIDELIRYRELRVPVGGFLQAVLENNLKEAVLRADDRNIDDLPEFVRWCRNHLPVDAWGSATRVYDWLHTEEKG